MGKSAKAGTDALEETQHRSNYKVPDEEAEVPLMITVNDGTTKAHYGGTATNGSTSAKEDEGVGMPLSPLPVRPSAAARRQQRDANNLGSSMKSTSSASWLGLGIEPGNDSVVLAPDGKTPLYGSSKLAANAIMHAEYKMEMEKERTVSLGNESDINNGSSKNALLSRPSCNTLGTMGTNRTARTLQEIQQEFLEKVRTSFMEDAMNFAEGTIPQSIIVAIVIGCVCGVVAYVYYYALDYFLELIWDILPEYIVENTSIPEKYYILWIPLVSFTLSIGCGLSIYYLGEPGDLAYTIQCIHSKGYKGTHHILPMIAASQCTILAGASLGPEAPLVAICAATAGFVSRSIFKQTNRNVVRKHTFMGMAGALSAFFGVPLGGSLFALEVASRFGIEYFEHLIESIFAGEVCVVVFRSLAGLPLGQIWNISENKLTETQPYMILLGGGIGLLGAGVAFIWANFHWRLMSYFKALNLLDDENAYAVPRVLLGACGVVILGMLVPQTMFWGEFEVGTIATLSPASALPHVWPTEGLLGFELDSWQNCLICGFAKLVAISFTVAGGYRGGFIFPFFAAGAAFGRALVFVFPDLSPVIACLCFAAGINVAITRTSLATPLILSFLAGEQFVLPAVLAASLVSLFATGYVPFIKSQLARSDIDFSLYYKKRHPKLPQSGPGAV